MRLATERDGELLARAIAAEIADGMGESRTMRSVRDLAERGADGVMWQHGIYPPMALRCPVCAGPVHPYRTLRFGEEHRCGKCGRSFDLVMVRRGLERVPEGERAATFAGPSPWVGGGTDAGGGWRSPERATLDEIEADPEYRRRSHRRAQPIPGAR